MQKHTLGPRNRWVKLLSPDVVKFKPLPFQHYKTDALVDAHRGFFRGSKINIVGMTGKLFSTFQNLMRVEYRHSMSNTESSQEKLKEERIEIITGLLTDMYLSVQDNKYNNQDRVIFTTGFCDNGIALTITHYAFNFPHIPKLRGGLTTVEMYNLMSTQHFYQCRSTTLTSNDNSVISDEELAYYRDLLNDDFIDKVDESDVSGHITDLIFQLTPYSLVTNAA